MASMKVQRLIDKIDNGLKQYYYRMNRTDYTNSEGVGKFKAFTQGFGIMKKLVEWLDWDMDDDDFDIHFLDEKFPLKPPKQNKQERKKEIIKIIKNVVTHGIYINWECVSHAIKHELCDNIELSVINTINKLR
eukprot:409039_1